jgi:hypothetical protein
MVDVEADGSIAFSSRGTMIAAAGVHGNQFLATLPSLNEMALPPAAGPCADAVGGG